MTNHERPTAGRFRRATVWLVLAGLLTTPPALAQALKTYNTRYYTLQCDLDEDATKEAILRITLMFEEYLARTRGFAGRPNRKLLFQLYKKYGDYVQSSEAPGSAGVFTGNRLVAWAGGENPWHTIQHEGFHQFVHFAMNSQKIPIWANEGLAEYFGEGVFTGDNFYTGFVPPERLRRVQRMLKDNQFPTLYSMMTMSHTTWNTQLKLEHYDQAWMMVHFLAHAENGKYQKAFQRFLQAAGLARNWEPVWQRFFGGDVGSFELRFREYWENLPADPTAELYARATTATFTSFYARAFSQGQFYDDWDQFVMDGRKGKLKSADDNWIPSALFDRALRDGPNRGQFSIIKKPGRRYVVCELGDGTQLRGQFKVRNRHVMKVEVKTIKGRKRRR